MRRRSRPASRWARLRAAHRDEGERGASLVEFAIVVGPLLLILFGILYFGVILSFKQAVTQSAAEGARAVAPVSGNASTALVTSTALLAANRPISGWSKTCTSSGMTCNISVAACQGNASAKCATVTVTYDYASHPILPSLPLLDNVLPRHIHSTAVVQMNP